MMDPTGGGWARKFRRECVEIYGIELIEPPKRCFMSW